MKHLAKALLVAVTATAGFYGGQLLLTNTLLAETRFHKPGIQVDASPLIRSGKFTASYKDVVDKAAPSVVYIFTQQTLKERRQPPMTPFFDDPFFRRFFGDQFGIQPGQPQPPLKRQGLGSGVIVSEDGYILTNTHVVEGADEIQVVLPDAKKSYDAKLVGTDPQTDVAVLKIDESGLPAITFADSDQVAVGDVVFAIGNPMGVGQSVTMGIVSAKGRSGFGMTEYEDFIQTDASINPGNSGGALVDAQGRLIGINTFIVSRSGGNQGLGFAIPVNLARFVMDQLAEHGKVTRGKLGVLIQSVTPDLAEAFELKDSKGALISEVNPGSPAEKAGLKAGDIVLSFNGKTVESHEDLRMKVARTTPGTKVKLGILRDGKNMTVAVTLGELGGGDSTKSLSGAWSDSSNLLSGVEIESLTDETRARYGIPNNVQGVVVTRVDPDSPAYERGLRPGQVIASINREPVRSAADAMRLARGSDKLLLLVRTPQGAHYLVLKGEKK